MDAYLLVLLLSGKSLPVQARNIFKWGLQFQMPLEMFSTISRGIAGHYCQKKSFLFLKILVAFYEKFSD